MSVERKKSCLLITYGPVPTSQYQTIEGGGMRVWGLAKGLKANGLDIAVAVNNSFPQELSEHEGIRLINWSLDDQFASLINSYDSVVMSYCMGDPSVFVVDNINDGVQLILDAYVPIYVEVSARESEDIDTEYENYMADIGRFNKVLRRGDYFLCANEAQKTFYTGVLSSLGIINPRSYRQDRILVVPFGIHNEALKASENPYQKLGIKSSDFVVLWFGGLYPWFRVEELLDAMLSLSKNKAIKFVFVGGKNPFNPNPDFFKQYDKAVAFSDKHGLNGSSVFFVDWVDFSQRVNWYVHSDMVISLNQPGEENKYSWRTRVMDYVWGELAILSNGGDPLSEDLITAQAAIRLPELSAKAIESAINDLYTHEQKLTAVKKAIKELKPGYYWDSVTKPVESVIAQGSLPYVDESIYKKALGVGQSADTPARIPSGRLQKAVRVAPALISKVRKKGVRRSAKLGVGMARTQIKRHKISKSQRRYVFISHPMDNTGAPLVLLQIVEEFAQKYGGRKVQLVAPVITPAYERRLRELGVNIDKAVFGLGFRFIRLQLGLRRNDFVLMNTAAIYDNYRDFVLLWLKTGRLKHAYWFIHEDIAQLPSIHKEFLDKQNIDQVHKLLAKDKLSVIVPSKRTQTEYNDLLKTDKVRSINLHVEVDNKFKRKLAVSDYSALNFLISGTPSDGRKGQLLALSAFYSFIKNYYEKDPSNYRDFKLHLVSIGNDYISQQVTWIGESLLQEHVAFYPSLPKAKALEVTFKCNAVICCSLNETFALYVAEGMFMGHVVLRNNSAGVDEQLQDGVNGYFVDHTDVTKFASVIEKLLNKKTNSDKDLQAMGQASQKIIASYSKNTYLEQIEAAD